MDGLSGTPGHFTLAETFAASRSVHSLADPIGGCSRDVERSSR
jgi:hypothetical protein